MDMLAFDAILLPVDGSPRIFSLMTSSVTSTDPLTGQRRLQRVPHPELHMNVGAQNTWVIQPIQSLFGMNRALLNPYLIFYVARPRAGPAPQVNQCIKEIQGIGYREQNAWRGDVVVAKYRDISAGEIVNCSASDFPLVKNYFALHYPTN